MVNDLGAFEQEIGFFEHCLPLLLKQCPDLPVVRCFYSNLAEKIIYMEDLKEQGYVSILRSVPDLKDDILSLDHFKVMVEALAKLHSASYGTDWAKEFPELFQSDSMFEGAGAEFFKNIFKKSAKSTILPIAEFEFSGNEELLKNIRWLASEDYYNETKKIAKADPATVNVICHGDCWVNNMMFKIDPMTKKPLDVKLIDFQICRYAPPSRDLLYCISGGSSVEFRQKHEKQIIRFYYDAFIQSCCDLGKDCSLTWDELYRDYDRARLFGLMMTVAFRPIIYLMEGAFPEGDNEVTEEQFKQLMEGGDGSDASMKAFRENGAFRKEMRNVIEDAHTTIQKWRQ